jgi:pimeloyl-ACP methyl ester carboxylesterase
VLLGVDFASEELSSIGSRHPEQVAGLIYVDGAHLYGYYSPERETFFSDPRFHVDLAELRRKLDRMITDGEENNPALLKELLTTDLPEFEKDLGARLKEFEEGRLNSTDGPPSRDDFTRRIMAMMEGVRRYSEIRGPVLALQGYLDPASSPSQYSGSNDIRAAGAKAFEKGVPQARVVLLRQSYPPNHLLWMTNEADVLREIHDFIRPLP